MDKQCVIAIDGPAGSGKSTVARYVAQRLGLQYIDSGALYRAITLYVLEQCGLNFTEDDVARLLPHIQLYQQFNPDGTCTTFCNGKDVSEKIRSETVAAHIGKISDQVIVRNHVNELMRTWAKNSAIIVDGRDIGTVVFPHATVKFYLDASVEQRALRRAKEYKEKGEDVDIEEIKVQIERRDKQDRERPFGALKKADDALYIDTSLMTLEEVINYVVDVIIRACNMTKDHT